MEQTNETGAKNPFAVAMGKLAGAKRFERGGSEAMRAMALKSAEVRRANRDARKLDEAGAIM